jgi:predicted nucleic acid-binding protein
MIIDSNILIYSLNEASSQKDLAQEYIQSNRDIAVVADQNILESYRVLTHPTYPHSMSSMQALKALNEIIDKITIIRPDGLTYSILLGYIQKYKLKGNTVFDAYLVATMMSNGIHTIATNNTKHFSQFEGIKVINPFE